MSEPQYVVDRVWCWKDGRIRFTHGEHDTERRLLGSSSYPAIRDIVYNMLKKQRKISMDDVKKTLLEELNVELINRQVGWIIRGIKIRYSVDIESKQKGRTPYAKRYYRLLCNHEGHHP